MDPLEGYPALIAILHLRMANLLGFVDFCDPSSVAEFRIGPPVRYNLISSLKVSSANYRGLPCNEIRHTQRPVEIIESYEGEGLRFTVYDSD